jgi:hypothetical protein
VAGTVKDEPNVMEKAEGRNVGQAFQPAICLAPGDGRLESLPHKGNNKLTS